MSAAGEGPEKPAPAVAVRAVQCRSDHGTQAWMVLCALCAAKSCPSAVVHWKAQTEGCFGKVHCAGSCDPPSALQ